MECKDGRQEALGPYWRARPQLPKPARLGCSVARNGYKTDSCDSERKRAYRLNSFISFALLTNVDKLFTDTWAWTGTQRQLISTYFLYHWDRCCYLSAVFWQRIISCVRWYKTILNNKINENIFFDVQSIWKIIWGQERSVQECFFLFLFYSLCSMNHFKLILVSSFKLAIKMPGMFFVSFLFFSSSSFRFL